VVTSENDEAKGKYNFHSAGEDRPVVLGLTTTQEFLENEAEIANLIMPCRTNHENITFVMEHFTVASRGNFINASKDMKNLAEKGKRWRKGDISEYDSDGLFTHAERAILLESMLNFLLVLDNADESSDLSKLFDSMGVSYRVSGNLMKSMAAKLHLKKPSSSLTTTSLCQVLKTHGFVDVICPVHIPSIRSKIERKTFSFISPPPLQAIRDYYGEAVAFYFAWMHHMTVWFMIPGILGLFVYLLRNFRGETIEDCDFTPLFGIVAFLWAILCVRFWERKEARLSYQFGTFAFTTQDRVKFGQRPNFEGKMRLNPVTGMMEKYYPAYKRRIKVAVSAFVTIVLLAGASVIMVISLNVQGYISQEDQERWDPSGEDAHPLYFPWFASLADEGGIFDTNSYWKSMIPALLRAVAVATMNKQYSKIAEQLSEWENHETLVDHENSLILKRLLFETFDAYIILFYLAIYERNITMLRAELVGAFNVDSLRRLFTESILPYIKRRFANKKSSGKSKKKDDDLADTSSDGVLTVEAGLDEYDQFDDYIEMLIQFGYVTLFASAYPLASFIAIFGNICESRSDAWKLGHLYRMPNPVRRSDIGTWKLALRVMVWTSALTNCFLFAFTSNQMRQWFPSNFTTDNFGRPMLVSENAHETVLIMFAIEHALFLIGLFVRSLVDKTPQDVVIEIEKRQWLHESNLAKARLQSTKVIDRRCREKKAD